MAALKFLEISDFRERVEVERNTPTRSASGSEVPSWAVVWHRWAAIRRQNAREFQAYFSTIAEAELVVVLRDPTAITAKDRISHLGHKYEIAGITTVDGKPAEYSRQIHLICREIVGSA